MKDNLAVRQVGGEWIVASSVSKIIAFTGTKKECEEYLEDND